MNSLFYHNRITLFVPVYTLHLCYLLTHLHMVTFVMNSLDFREMYQYQKQSFALLSLILIQCWEGSVSYHHYVVSIYFGFSSKILRRTTTSSKLTLRDRLDIFSAIFSGSSLSISVKSLSLALLASGAGSSFNSCLSGMSS